MSKNSNQERYMKYKNVIASICAILFTIGVTVTANAGDGCGDSHRSPASSEASPILSGHVEK